MNRDHVVQCLTATLLPEPETQKAATAELDGMHKIAGFTPLLMELVMTDEIELSLRQSAAVYLKNTIHKTWPLLDPDVPLPPGTTHFSIHHNDKTIIRQQIFPCFLKSTLPIRRQMCQVLSTILKEDYPAYWANFPEQLLEMLSDQNPAIFRVGVEMLYQFLKNYEYKTKEERKAIAEPMKHFLPLLLQRIQTLLQTYNDESAELCKLAVKVYHVYTQYTIDQKTLTRELIAGYTHLFEQLINIPLPAAVEEEDEPYDNVHWKVKKWSMRCINRFFERYGSPGSVQKDYKEIASWYVQRFASTNIDCIFKLLARYGHKQFVSRPCMQIGLNFVCTAVAQATCWKMIKPVFAEMVENVVFPLMCHDEEAQEQWESDPVEYIHIRYDLMDDFMSPTMAATSLLNKAASKRKEVLEKTMGFAMQKVTDPAVVPQHLDGAFHIIGSLATVLMSKKMYRERLEDMLARYVYPQFASPHPFLRARCCWLLARFSELKFKNDENYVTAINFLRFSLCQETEMPVKFEAALALQEAVQNQQKARVYVKPYVQEIIVDLLKLIQETENDELTTAVQNFVSEFPDDIQPKAVEITTSLAATFCQLISSDENCETNEKTIVALGVLNTIENLLEVMEDQKETMVELERIVLQVISLVLQKQFDDFYEEVFSMIEELTAHSISAVMWEVFEFMCSMFNEQEEAYNYFTDMMPALHNYATVDPITFMAKQENMEKLFTVCSRILSSDPSIDVGEDAECHAAKFLEVMLLQYTTQVTHLMQPFVELVLTRLSKDVKTSELRVMLIQVVVAALYSDPQKLLSILATIQAEDSPAGFVPKFIAQWVHDSDCFFGIHDRKIYVLGMCALLNLTHEQKLASFPSETLPQLMPHLLMIFMGLKKAYETRTESQKLDNGEEDDEDEENGIERANELDSDEDEDESKTNGILQCDETGSDDDSDDDYIDDDYDETELEIYETPIDKEDTTVDEYVTFQATMQRLSAEEGEFYSQLIASVPEDRHGELKDILEEAEKRRVIVLSRQIEKDGGYNFAAGGDVPSAFNFGVSSPPGSSKP